MGDRSGSPPEKKAEYNRRLGAKSGFRAPRGCDSGTKSLQNGAYGGNEAETTRRKRRRRERERETLALELTSIAGGCVS